MNRKWYSLIDKVYRKTSLKKAFKTVKSNKEAPGVDGETVDDFAGNLTPILPSYLRNSKTTPMKSNQREESILTEQMEVKDRSVYRQ